MDIPERVKIGPHWFDVDIVDVVDKTTYLRGQINVVENKIRLSGEMTQSKKEESLFHEVLHEIDASLCTGLSEEDVGRLAYGFYQFLVDNDLLK